MTGYQMNFNQDFTSISVLNDKELRIYTIGADEKIDEIFMLVNEDIRLVERLFNSSLVVLVTGQKPNCLRMLHFKKRQDICNCVYPSDILCVRMNRHRLVVCLAESMHIHDIRDMKILHSIENVAPNDLGLCSLSMNANLAFPICTNSGELRIFNAFKMRSGPTIKAHSSALSALSFSADGALLATASERGTVIRVFCVKNGQRVQELRRGVKRCVRIASLVFSASGEFLCTSSNTETVHIFKIDPKAVEAAARKPMITAESGATGGLTGAPGYSNSSRESGCGAAAAATGGWSGYLTKAVSSYLIPAQVSDVLSQDRAFATAILTQPGTKHVCGLVSLQNELKLLVACADGFLYIYDLNLELGGACKLQTVHDLRYALEGVVELNLTESVHIMSLQNTPTDSCESLSPQTNVVGKKSGRKMLIENPQSSPDKSYAGILKGEHAGQTLTDSAKFRKLCDAIDTPTKLFDDHQFPPVAIAAKE